MERCRAVRGGWNLVGPLRGEAWSLFLLHMKLLAGVGGRRVCRRVAGMLRHFLLFPAEGFPGSPVTLEACRKHTRRFYPHKMSGAILCFYLVISIHFTYIR